MSLLAAAALVVVILGAAATVDPLIGRGPAALGPSPPAGAGPATSTSPTADLVDLATGAAVPVPILGEVPGQG
jgi:hypothetical protein